MSIPIFALNFSKKRILFNKQLKDTAIQNHFDCHFIDVTEKQTTTTMYVLCIMYF